MSKVINGKTEQQRLDDANELIETIASCGRRFFYYCRNISRDMFLITIAKMEVRANGKVWFLDEYTGVWIYTHYSGRWRWFSSGGTLRSLIECLRDYIKNGTKILLTTGMWDYDDESVKIVNDKARELGITK